LFVFLLIILAGLPLFIFLQPDRGTQASGSGFDNEKYLFDFQQLIYQESGENN
jgi:preprotein translocase subunit SecG